jgi:hypothetical protein
LKRPQIVLTLARSPWKRKPELSKSLSPWKKGWDEGKEVGHRGNSKRIGLDRKLFE